MIYGGPGSRDHVDRLNEKMMTHAFEGGGAVNVVIKCGEGGCGGGAVTASVECPRCRGAGKNKVSQLGPWMARVVTVTCTACRGTGKVER